MRFALRTLLAAALLSGSFACLAQTATGTLVMEVDKLQSEVPLSKELQELIRTGGVDWGIKGNELVLTVVDTRYLDFDYGFTTRYGYRHALQLPVGNYRITAVSREPRRSYSEQRLLDRATFVNRNVASFTIEAGKTVTVQVGPVIMDEDALNPAVFIPTLFASVSSADGGAPGGAAPRRKAVTLRDNSSTAWPDYRGPIKFIPR
ncbi:hypothetical protein [Stenotrophomonas rhizophila]|uniref:hypothetical protein n=1 Tax=Stenotrophomonas rhizophila TaxID=216778 RepID=UPI00081C7AB9|nr:hypothetical protein [Stenotrophomonas rhizophila]AOA73331.1 hypothetical protein BAY15_2897 [Stenotrophomonas rhizophila]